MRIGLYFGSFNPIHKGHLEVAHYMKQHAGFDSVWFIPSPLNPHKSGETLIPANLRLEWVQAAIKDTSYFECKDDEFHLSLPSYTYKTLMHLVAQYPNLQFGIIMGADNLHGFHTWQNAEELAAMAPLHVYARPGFEKPPAPLPYKATWYDAPLIDISATEIRDLLWQEKSAEHLIPEAITEPLIQFFNRRKMDQEGASFT